jgi:hypothetical protein
MPRTFKLLALMILLGAVSAKAQDNSGSIKDALPPGINLNDAKLVEIRDEAGSVVLTGTFSNSKADLRSATGALKAKGLAEIEIEKDGVATKQEIEVEVTNLLALTTFKLFVDGKEVAKFTTNKSGRRELKYTRKDP